MTSTHLQELHGLPVFDFLAAAPGAGLPAASSVAWRVGLEDSEGEERWSDLFSRFLATVDTTEVRALVIGLWNEPYDESSEAVIAALSTARELFPRLRAVFLGDITYEECEISWIIQTSVAPLLGAFPGLLEFGVRGGTGLALPALRHERLRSLTIETGGLDRQVVQGVAASELPELERLDIWLGSSGYGGDTELADLEPILSGGRLPRLLHLALHNSEIQDEIAVALAGAPVVAGLETLDLSMGTLGDEGAEALLSGQPLDHLKRLDLHHHFISGTLAHRLASTLGAAGVEVDLSRSLAGGEEFGEPGHRYVAVAE
ncbi:STM4015 family protein [Streptomyces sp. CAU 1734]|uniref:STM4015 family protein n=1 Tax=Streptomyces sp. CAU 1734 TaxID=3140360 RepID=UPI003261C842